MTHASFSHPAAGGEAGGPRDRGEVRLLCTQLGVRHRRRQAVVDLDWQVGSGIHALLGPNGAGKSSLMSVLSSGRAPDSGTWSFDGVPATEVQALRRVTGYLPQEVRFYARMTVRENLEYFAWLRCVPAADTDRAIAGALEVCRLTDRADDRVRSLSGGMRRRLGIAQAVLSDPSLVILDEPTAGLDIAQRALLVETMSDLAAQGACVVMSTHLASDLDGVCDSVLVLSEGRAVYQGPKDGMVAEGEDFEGAYLRLVAA